MYTQDARLPPSLQMLISRVSYFPLMYDKLEKLYARAVGLSQDDEIWLAAEATPLKWWGYIDRLHMSLHCTRPAQFYYTYSTFNKTCNVVVQSQKLCKAVSYKAHYWICVQVVYSLTGHCVNSFWFKVPQIRFDSSAVCFEVLLYMPFKIYVVIHNYNIWSHWAGRLPNWNLANREFVKYYNYVQGLAVTMVDFALARYHYVKSSHPRSYQEHITTFYKPGLAHSWSYWVHQERISTRARFLCALGTCNILCVAR